MNEVMEEIEDHLDSDEDDQAYLVTKNSSTGGNEAALGLSSGAQADLAAYAGMSDKSGAENQYNSSASASYPAYDNNDGAYYGGHQDAKDAYAASAGNTDAYYNNHN